MRIEVTLRAADEAEHETSVASTIEVAADDLRWPGRLAETVARRALEGAHCLREHLLEAPPCPPVHFVPLADVVPTV